MKHLSVVRPSAALLLVSDGRLSCPQLQSSFLRSLSPRCGSPIVLYPDPQDLQDQTTPKAMLHAATLTHSHVRHADTGVARLLPFQPTRSRVAWTCWPNFVRSAAQVFYDDVMLYVPRISPQHGHTQTAKQFETYSLSFILRSFC